MCGIPTIITYLYSWHFDHTLPFQQGYFQQLTSEMVEKDQSWGECDQDGKVWGPFSEEV